MVKWQKSFRTVPARVEHKLRKWKTRTVMVGCIAKLRPQDIRDGEYVHLEIVLKNGTPSFPKSVVPHSSAGRSSSTNANGREIVRRDLPMVRKTYTIETPNFGDWSNGSHDFVQVIVYGLIYIYIGPI
jgi:hypothetical protein